MSSIDFESYLVLYWKNRKAPMTFKGMWSTTIFPLDKISVPSIYRKVLQLSEKGYLQSDIVKRR